MIPFAEHCSRVEAHIEHAYRIRVVTVDVPDPLTGDLDGAEIHLDFALTPEQRLFLRFGSQRRRAQRERGRPA